MGRTLATNCACIYNETMVNAALQQHLPSTHQWSYCFHMLVTNVWTGFFIHALLHNLAEQQELGIETEPLQVDQTAALQFERLMPALAA
jgi:hypothetical protein